MDLPPRNNFLKRAQLELDELRARSQVRHLETVPGVDFSSNDYLGLATDPRLAQAVQSALAAGVPAGSTGSRLLSGHFSAWDELEEEFARFAGTEAALFFNSGYAANTGLFSCLLTPDEIVFSDSANHASIIDGIRLSGARKIIFPHLDLNVLEAELRRESSSRAQKLIVVESVFSMDGDRAPICDLLALAERYSAELIVDEAHATGVFGPHGGGLVAEAHATERVLAVVHTCGKGLGSAGAFVAGSKTLKEYLINRARPFIFSTALPPYIAAQVQAAIEIACGADSERTRLHFMFADFRKQLTEAGFDTGKSHSQIVPVIAGENETALSWAAYLREHGFAVRAIRPPTVPPGTARLRLSLTVKHTPATLHSLIESLIEARERLAVMRSQAG
jgi:8-amino-7-oxononanoate synthase